MIAPGTVRRTRFAPAPTGFLHLGHVVNAIYVWGFGRSRGADVLLRVEDHDAQRARREYEDALLDDLAWLGFAPDVGSPEALRAGPSPFRQHNRHDVYASIAATWIAEGRVYGCACTRQDLPASSMTGVEARYPGTCASRGLPCEDGLVWRVRMPEGVVRFDDEWCGPQAQEPATQCGDIAIRDRLGNWTYQFVASVDDHLMGIDLVIRGEDLLASTGRQVLLAGLAGRRAPARFGHHPLLMKSATQKLSKSDGDTGVRDLRRAGWTPQRVIGEAAFRAGLISPLQPVAATEVGALFGH